VITFVKAMLRPDAPLVLVAVLAIVAVWWWRRPASRWPWRLLVAFLGVLYLATTQIGANVLVAGLGHGLTRITTREQARGAEAVVVLGGGVQTVKTADVILSQLSTTASLRILEAARVYKLIGARLVIVSGGIGDERLELRPEGEQMATALIASGVPADHIALDLDARNTHDHPGTVRPFLDANRIRQFVVVTSPTHMRRAMRVFRAAGYDPVPSVSLMRSEQLGPPPLFVPNDDSIFLSDQAFYEYGAWALYWWRGWLR
jgi:uncharacterized SAM-binding protein YcdF (DUF218 family)